MHTHIWLVCWWDSAWYPYGGGGATEWDRVPLIHLQTKTLAL